MDRLFKKNKDKEKKKAKRLESEEKSLDDVIRDKDAERKKLEEEELEFQQKKRERERKIIQIEKEELDRREDEVRVRRAEYDQVKKTNEAVEDKLEGKIKELQMELEDKKLDHRSAEGTIERDITARVRVITDLRRSLTRRMEELGGYEKISASPSAPELAALDLVDSARSTQAEPYNPFNYRKEENTLDMTSSLEPRTMDTLKKSSNSLCRSLESIHSPESPATRGRSTAATRAARYDRTRSLARAELDPPVPLYPTVPDLDPGQMFPTVPDFEPGEEEDIYKTIKRSPKRKRAQKTLIDAVD